MYKILFEKHARKQFFKLNRDVQKRLTRAIDSKLAVDPKVHLIPCAATGPGFLSSGSALIGYCVRWMMSGFMSWLSK